MSSNSKSSHAETVAILHQIWPSTCILVREVLRLAEGAEEAVFLLFNLDGDSVPKPGASPFLIFLMSINSLYTTFSTMLSEVACFLTALKAT